MNAAYPPMPVALTERQAALSRTLQEEITLDVLTRDFKVFQRRRGHRYSTDDLLTAWYAAEAAPRADSLLDLGSGIGSVGLMTLWRLTRAAAAPVRACFRACFIEAQDMSHRLLTDNLWANGLEGQVRAIHDDLRNLAAHVEPQSFALVTGSPPYFTLGTAIVPIDAQKAHARFELRGDVSDYCRAARHALAAGGRFVFCFPTEQRDRAERALAGATLALLTVKDVQPKAGAKPLFSLFLACRGEEHAGGFQQEPALIVRGTDGRHTPEMAAVRPYFGLER